MKDYYKVLSLNQEVSFSTINRRTYVLGLKEHPSRRKKSREKFSKILEAHYILGNENYRAIYDKLLNHQKVNAKLLEQFNLRIEYAKTLISKYEYNSIKTFKKKYKPEGILSSLGGFGDFILSILDFTTIFY